MAFGDLYLEDVRSYREQRLSGTGIAPIFPSAGAATPPHSVNEMLAGGLRALSHVCRSREVAGVLRRS